MRVRVSYIVNADDDYRMSIHHRYGKHGTLASREEVKQHHELNGASMDDDLWDEWERCEDGCHADR